MLEQILALQAEGLGLRRIAEELGTTYGKVRYAVSAHNSAANSAVERRDSAPAAHKVRTYVWDLETTNLNTFFGKLTVGVFMDINTGEILKATLFDFPGSMVDKEVALLHWVVDRLEEADILIGHNTLAFDLSFIRGRLAIHHEERQLPRRQHWDTLQIAKFGFKGRPQGYSLENLADFFGVGVKDHPSKHDWAASVILDEEAIERIAERCVSDVLINAAVFDKLRPYFHNYKGK